MFSAKVKSVLSGDSLVLTSTKSKPGTAPPPEKTFALAYVTAPRIRREGDEPFAFESRDFLRKLLVGKDVSFSAMYTSSAKREYGDVVSGGRSMLEAAVEEGWVKVRDDAGKNEKDAEATAHLRNLETKAREAKKGIWSEIAGVTDVRYESPPEAEVKHKVVDSIVERVLNGDKLSVRIMTPERHYIANLGMAGIRCPQAKRSDGQGNAEDYGDEAKLFVESRLMQRSVKVEVVGTSQQGLLVAHVTHPAGKITELLLQNGLARCADWMSPMVGSEMAALRAAEGVAKGRKLNLWKGHVSGVKSGPGFDAIVSRIVSADSITVRQKSGEDQRLHFSSIRGPKVSDPKQLAYANDAKEFLRKRLIGKHVNVSIDHVRPASEGFEARQIATVTISGKNVALGLVEAGLALVIKHRRDDEDRSPIYDELMAAEQIALDEQKGLHSPKEAPTVRIVDASESVAKAKAFLTFLQRQKRIAAVVEHVAAGSRFKVLVPRENAKITFVLSGIRTPRAGRPNEQSEPFGQDALNFTTKRCLQRDVEIEVESTDRSGGFVGSLYVGKEDLAVLLLEEGLATVHEYSAEYVSNSKQLYNAQSNAQKAQRRIWNDYIAEKETALDAPATGAEVSPAKKEYIDIVITDVSSNGTLQVQIVSSGTQQLTQLMSKFRQFHLASNEAPLTTLPSVGECISAQFSEDKKWYRARVRAVDRSNNKVEVTYIDYGNGESVALENLRTLHSQFSTSALQAQCHEAVLSFLVWPNQDYAQEAVAFLASVSAGKQLVANIDQRTGNTMSLTLFDAHSSTSAKESLNKEMVRHGWTRVEHGAGSRGWQRAYNDIIKELQLSEKQAMKERKGLWEYGDPTADE